MADSVWHSPATKEWFMETRDTTLNRKWIRSHEDSIRVIDAHECLDKDFLELLRWRKRDMEGQTRLSEDDKQAFALVYPGLVLLRMSMTRMHEQANYVDAESRTCLALLTQTIAIIDRICK